MRKPEIDATLIAESIAQQLERRVAFRRAMKARRTVGHAAGRRGVSASTARVAWAVRKSRVIEWYREGRVPLHNAARRCRLRHRNGIHDLRAPVAIKGLGVQGGEILEHDPMAQDKRMNEEGGRSGGGRRDHAA